MRLDLQKLTDPGAIHRCEGFAAQAAVLGKVDVPAMLQHLGIEALKESARYDAMVKTLTEQVELLGKELRTTSQRVNLFEKVKIPEAKENIRVIGIYLQDQQTSAVVRGKIAKKKLVKVS